MSRDFDRVYLGQAQGLLWDELCDLPGHTKAIGNYYLWRASTEDGDKFTNAYASNATIAKATSFSVSSVKRSSQVLCELGFLERKWKPVKHGFVHEYRMNPALYDLVKARVSSGEKGALKQVAREIWQGDPSEPGPLRTGSPQNLVPTEPPTRFPENPLPGSHRATIYPLDLPLLSAPGRGPRGDPSPAGRVTPVSPTTRSPDLDVQKSGPAELHPHTSGGGSAESLNQSVTATGGAAGAIPPLNYRHPFWLTMHDKIELCPGVEAAEVWRGLLAEYPEPVLREAMVAAAPVYLERIRKITDRCNKGHMLLSLIRAKADIKLKYHQQEKRKPSRFVQPDEAGAAFTRGKFRGLT